MEQEYHKMMATADQLKKLIEDPALQLSQAWWVVDMQLD